MKGRQRLVKPQIHSDPELWDAEIESGLPMFRAFVGLLNFADREGRFEWKPRQLKVLILPHWNGDFRVVLDELAKRRFVVRYVVADAEFGVVRTFKRHQSINGRESESELPAPPSGYESLPYVADASGTREARVVTVVPGLVGYGTGGVTREPTAQDAPDGAAPRPSAPKQAKKPTAAAIAKSALSAAVDALASEFGHEVPPTASKAHMATAASKVLGLMAKGAEPAQAAERVARASYERLAGGKSSTFGYALNDCVIGPGGPRTNGGQNSSISADGTANYDW